MESTSQVAQLSLAQRRGLDSQKARNRSRITNGKDLFRPEVTDLRSATYRRYRDLVDMLVVDQGGIDLCSESRKQLIRRFAACCVLSEQMEARLVADEEISVPEHALLVSSLVRLANKLGINRVAKNIGPTLGELLRADLDRKAGVDHG
jgi:hypothetical protein